MKKATIDIASPKPAISSLLIIYTGGTLGMSYDESGKHLVPFDFAHILQNMPELRQFEYTLTVLSLSKLIDSSNMNPEIWIEIACIIRDEYEEYDGFVILHGTDTMAYTASALSFLLENLSKPVILTGAQLPIGSVRTDAHRNLVTSIQIAAATENGQPVVPEVCIFFNDALLRGNRCRKVMSDRFDAFYSENYPELAHVGIHIDYNKDVIQKYQAKLPLKVHTKMDTGVNILRLFPGMTKDIVQCIFTNPKLRAIILETYGSGNAPTYPWFIDLLERAIQNGVIVYNVSQCLGGQVEQGRYDTSRELLRIGVIGGQDITTESAISKLMFLLGQNLPIQEIKSQLRQDLRGELTENQLEVD